MRIRIESGGHAVELDPGSTELSMYEVVREAERAFADTFPEKTGPAYGFSAVADYRSERPVRLNRGREMTVRA